MYRICIIEGDLHDPTTELIVYAHDLGDVEFLGGHVGTSFGIALHQAAKQLRNDPAVIGTTFEAGRDEWIFIERVDIKDVAAFDRLYDDSEVSA